MARGKAKNDTEKNTRSSGRRERPFRPFDFVIIACIIVLSIVPLLLKTEEEADTVVITWHGQEIYRDKLSKDNVIITPDGSNTIVIFGGKVHMEEADCPDDICKRAGEATPSHPIVCLPNNVIVSIEGSEEVDSSTW